MNNLHSVTSNAVAQAISKRTYLIPIKTNHMMTNSNDWVRYAYIGNYFMAKFNSYPNISGKTKKVRLIFTAFTESSNSIIISISNDTGTNREQIFQAVVWGGVTENSFQVFGQQEINIQYLNAYNEIDFKSSDASMYVAIGYVFAEIYYE